MRKGCSTRGGQKVEEDDKIDKTVMSERSAKEIAEYNRQITA